MIRCLSFHTPRKRARTDLGRVSFVLVDGHQRDAMLLDTAIWTRRPLCAVISLNSFHEECEKTDNESWTGERCVQLANEMH